MPEEPTPADRVVSHPSLRRAEPDAHGQAALLLAESILHTLVDTGKLTTAQAVDVVRAAADVKRDIAAEIGESVGRMRGSLALLSNIQRGFMMDELFGDGSAN